jgi:MFS family permease
MAGKVHLYSFSTCLRRYGMSQQSDGPRLMVNNKSKLFYGWYIVAACFVILIFNAGARYAFGVMFKPIIADFGWSRGAISLAFTVNMVVFAFALIVVGKIYDRYGPKWLILVSTLLISGGFILTAFMRSMWEFIFSYGILAALGMAGTAVPLMSTLISRWFVKHRGLTVSIALAGNSAGQALLVPLLSMMAIGLGWRSAYLLIGIAMFVINVILVLFVIKGDPHQLGLAALGSKENEEQERNGEEPTGAAVAAEDIGLKDAMRTSSYWCFILVMFICGGGDYLATTALIPLATDFGISALSAGNMLGWYGAMSLIGILIAGPLSDRIGTKLPIIMTFLLRLALYALILRFKAVWSFYVFALLFGLTHLITAPLTPVLIGRMFGNSHLGVLSGFVNTIHFLGGGLWVSLAGELFDRTGSYQLIFQISAVAALVAVIAALFVAEKRHRLGPRTNVFS